MGSKPLVHLGDDEIAVLKESSLLVGKTLAVVAERIAPGVTTGELDRLAEEFIRDTAHQCERASGARPSR